MSFIPRTAWMVWVIGYAAVLRDGLRRLVVVRTLAPPRAAGAIGRAHVLFDDPLEVFGDALALERDRLRTVDVDRRDRTLARARQADTDVRVLRFARPVDDA